MLVPYKHPDVVPIVHGTVEIFIPEYELVVTAKVKQIKGNGVHDAIQYKDRPADDQHLELITTALRLFDEGETKFTAETLRFEVKRDRVAGERMQEFKQAHFTRKLSELIFWKVFTKVEGSGQIPLYRVDIKLALNLKNGGVFGA